MNADIAVTSAARELKRLLLLFDRVGVDGLDTLLYVTANGFHDGEREIPPRADFHDDLAALIADDVLFQPKLEELDGQHRDDALRDYDAALSRRLEATNKRLGVLVVKRVVLQGKQKGMFPDWTPTR
jgi:hypothetical protein